MTITITNLPTKTIKDYLSINKKQLPLFTTQKTYNGLVVDIDDEDVLDFIDTLESEGFMLDCDDEELEALKEKASQ